MSACGDDGHTEPDSAAMPIADASSDEDGTISDSAVPDSAISDSAISDAATSDAAISDAMGADSAPADGSGGSPDAMKPNCAAGDGPSFNVTNNGFSDFSIDGVNDPALTVVRGCSYTFTINTPGHPFLIKTVAGPGLLSTYDEGVSNQGTQNGALTWDVSLAAPSSLFYNCQFHAAMAGTITVIDG